jgi:hypothetical protein
MSKRKPAIKFCHLCSEKTIHQLKKLGKISKEEKRVLIIFAVNPHSISMREKMISN